MAAGPADSACSQSSATIEIGAVLAGVIWPVWCQHSGMEPYESYEPDLELCPRRRSVRAQLLRVASYPSMILTCLVGVVLGWPFFVSWLAVVAVAFVFGVMIEDAADLADSCADDLEADGRGRAPAGP